MTFHSIIMPQPIISAWICATRVLSIMCVPYCCHSNNVILLQYRTILSLSVVYCLGNITMSVSAIPFENASNINL